MLREITNKKEEILQFPETESVTVDKVLKNLQEHYGRAFTNYVYDHRTGEVRGILQFLVNGKSVLANQGLQSELQDGDVLAIIPPVGGG